jgi:hypothetical protein
VRGRPREVADAFADAETLLAVVPSVGAAEELSILGLGANTREL